MSDPKDDYRSIIRAARQRLETEMGFGIDDLPMFDKDKPKSEKPADDAPSAKESADADTSPKESTDIDTSPKDSADTVGPDASPEERAEALKALEEKVLTCEKCPLHEGRTKVVFGAGNPDADLMFVGEAPGRDEDLQGEPFVGRAGKLLTKIIEAIDMKRSDVYIGNILKCRPPNNRNPLPTEMVTCMPYLRKQIRLIQPKILCALGSTAVQGLLKTREGITKIRGTFQEFEGIKLMPTYHPAYLLRNPNGKRDVWEDMQLIRDTLKEMTKGK